MFKVLSALSGAICAGCLLAAGSGATAPPVRYYLALGDSLSQGQQPDQTGVTRNTDQGYPDQLFALLRRRIPGLRLVKLGCGGESTTSMISGRGNPLAKQFKCHPAGGAQLTAAIRFLRAHHARGEVPVVTIDLGANDVDRCANMPFGQAGSCVSGGEAKIKRNLPIILGRLQGAAAAGTRLVGMEHYDPVLADYLNSDPNKRSLAEASVVLAKQVNGIIDSADTHAGWSTAAVAQVFATYDSTHTVSWNGQQVPVNVATVCSWTWACTPPPSGPNIHANKNGYAEIALAFWARLVKQGFGK